MHPRFPDEINLLVYSHLEARDLLSIIRTSKANQKLGSDFMLWSSLLKRDFLIDKKQEQHPKDVYEKIVVSGIPRERFRFAAYMTALHILDTQGQVVKAKLGKPALQAWEELDYSACRPQNEFLQYYETLTSFIEKKELEQKWQEFHNQYISFLSPENIPRLDISAALNANADKVEHMVPGLTNAMAIFLILCKIDAASLLDNLFKILPESGHHCLIVHACHFPCENTISRLLNLNINLNRKFWMPNPSVHGGYRHVTPLTAAVNCLVTFKHYDASRNIISTLLRHGADVDSRISSHDNSGFTENDFAQKSISIREKCAELMTTADDPVMKEILHSIAIHHIHSISP